MGLKRSLLEQDSGPADLLGAQRAQERGHDPVHELEVGRQRGDALLRVVEDLFVERIGVEDGAGAAVDENEPRLQDEALALHVGADRDHAAAAERIVDFAVLHHEAVVLMRREEDGAGDDQRRLVFLAQLLPVGDVGEQLFVGFEILVVLDQDGDARRGGLDRGFSALQIWRP